MEYSFDFEKFEFNGKTYSGTVSYDVEWSSEITDSSGYFTSSDQDDDDECAVVESYTLDELFEVSPKGETEIETTDPLYKSIEDAISHLVDSHCDSLELERDDDESEYGSDDGYTEDE